MTILFHYLSGGSCDETKFFSKSLIIHAGWRFFDLPKNSVEAKTASWKIRCGLDQFDGS
jgi:hypothetical protein